jgi:hypothetical protein
MQTRGFVVTSHHDALFTQGNTLSELKNYAHSAGDRYSQYYHLLRQLRLSGIQHFGQAGGFAVLTAGMRGCHTSGDRPKG